MSEVTLNPMFNSIKGNMGGIILYNAYDKIYTRIHSKAKNPDTPQQKKVRGVFAEAVRSWQELTIEEKEKYNRKARKFRKRGYNLFISRYLKYNLPYQQPDDSEQYHKPVCLKGVFSLYPAVSSAAAPLTKAGSTFYHKVCTAAGFTMA
jgi:hypothetical protein